MLLQKISKIWKYLTQGSVNRQILGASIIVGSLTLFVKSAGVIKELIVAWKFGTGDNIDAFLIALLVPSFIINVVAGSFHAILIPKYIQVQEQEGKKASQRLFSGVTIWALGLLVITTILMLVTAPFYLPLIATGFDQQKLELTFHLLYVIAPIISLNGITVIFSAVLNAGEHFALAAITPMVTSGITIIFLLGFESYGSSTLVAGLICGAVVEIAVLAAGLKHQGISIRPKWYGFNPHLLQVISQYMPTVAGSFLMCSAGLVDKSMAAMLSPGSVAALSYSDRLVTLPIFLITTALNTVVVPYFSKMVTNNDWAGIRHTLKHYLQLIFLVTVPLTGVLITFSEPITRLLLQRGSFTASDTQIVAQIQNLYALQIPFYVSAVFIVKLIISLQKNHILMWGSGLNLIVNITANLFFMHFLGIKGIALSTSCVYLTSFCFLLFFAFKYLKQIELNQESKSV
ncbi:integral membrane protein MviN [Cylindrospermum stagnale PCC 7417]|uniref:Integral membrane protein MviN n=1 Tax=Cylindrospermum stagnale PCC 7417 TaxID=56107 RepID=K9X103_9NOST|nr:murein biosynthesis integral membrane protein MurJ [Cylindrospermum stagnale]AFZ26295.1 integral membrane protein MviN [Cylindrospermum stagnale PCC 7417]